PAEPRPRGAAVDPLGRRLPGACTYLPRGAAEAALSSSSSVLLRVGFPAPARLPAAGGLLPAPFHLRRRLRGGCVFSVALSFGSPRPGVTRHPALRSSDSPRRDDPGATAWRTRSVLYPRVQRE